ncbi:MAG TPA: hypothetical protein VFJ84_01320 [Candidatus Saccharimonadales bacterium]|nr:hypothetical protein [Candidatus Saccharimonadales bacterium]
MILKSISLVTGLVTLDVYLQSQLSSNGPLFYLVSDNTIINILMILLAAAGVLVTFRGRFKSWYGYMACLSLGAIMILMGLAGVFFDSLIYSFWSVFSPLNYALLLEYGIIFSICSLAFKHAKRPKDVRLALSPAYLLLRLKLALPVPKIPHFPPLSRRETASGTN